MRHGNTPLAPGDQRLGLTQYAAGGMFRWVENGFRTSQNADEATQTRMAAEAAERYGRLLNLYSKHNQLSKDRCSV